MQELEFIDDGISLLEGNNMETLENEIYVIFSRHRLKKLNFDELRNELVIVLLRLNSIVALEFATNSINKKLKVYLSD